MLLAPNDVYEKLEFDKIKEWLTAQCLGEPGKERIAKLVLQTQKFMVERMLNEAEEYKTIFDEGHHFPMSNYENLDEEIRMLKVAGFVMSELQLKRLADNIRTRLIPLCTILFAISNSMTNCFMPSTA